MRHGQRRESLWPARRRPRGGGVRPVYGRLCRWSLPPTTPLSAAARNVSPAAAREPPFLPSPVGSGWTDSVTRLRRGFQAPQRRALGLGVAPWLLLLGETRDRKTRCSAAPATTRDVRRTTQPPAPSRTCTHPDHAWCADTRGRHLGVSIALADSGRLALMSSVRAHPRRFRWLPHAAVLSQSARPTALESLQFTNLPHAPCFVRGGLGARRSLSQAPPSPARVAAICRSLCSPHRVVTGSGWPWPAPQSRQEAPEPAPPKAGFNHTTAPAPQMPHPRGGPGRRERPRESESCESCRVSPCTTAPHSGVHQGSQPFSPTVNRSSTHGSATTAAHTWSTRLR